MQRPSDAVFNSPALHLLCDLEDAGLDLSVLGDRLQVWPRELIAPGQEQRIQHHRANLIALVAWCNRQHEQDADGAGQVA